MLIKFIYSGYSNMRKSTDISYLDDPLLFWHLREHISVYVYKRKMYSLTSASASCFMK